MKKNIQILIESLFVFLLVYLMTITNFLSSLDHLATDSLYQNPRGISTRIKIIGIDERTLSQYGPVQTWSRQRYGELIEKLNENSEAKPLIIGFDINFSGEVDDGDAYFAEKAAESGNVVVVNHLLYDRKKEERNGVLVNPINSIEQPYKQLFDNCLVGYSNVAEDRDGVVRRIISSESYENETYYMFSAVLYKEYCRLTGQEESEIPSDSYGRSIINYSGRPGDFECISMTDILEGRVDTRTFKDSIVLVGSYAPGMQDSFRVPNGRGQQMFGVEIHANILQSFIQGRFAIDGDAYMLGVVTGLIAALLHMLFRKLKIWQSLILFVFSCVAEAFICVIMNNNGFAYQVIYFPIVLTVSYVYCIGIGYIMEKARKKKVLSAFQKYVAPQVVEEISKTGDFSIKVGGENRDIAALFVDIRGFTTMSEALEPEQVVEILNEYLSMTTAAIFRNMGTLDKFVGDCTMAVFNSPFDLPDYEYKAVSAALDIVNDGKALQESLLKKYGRTIGYGVGVNVGPAVVGNIGCDVRMDFTAIGDTVNTAARLEANAKAGQVLISDVLYERLKGRIEVNGIGEIPLKGKTKGVYVYEVLSLIEDSKDSEEDSKQISE